jgi:hypothetical protein
MEVCQRMGQVRLSWKALVLSPLMPRRKVDESDETVSDFTFIGTHARDDGGGSRGGWRQLP